MDQWAFANRMPLHFLRPGKPVENAFVESFNGRFRDECLDTQWFADLEHARRVIAAWCDDYNNVRPHGSLDGRTPPEYERDFNQRLTQRVAKERGHVSLATSISLRPPHPGRAWRTVSLRAARSRRHVQAR